MACAQQLSGALNWLATKTRPDIVYSVSRIASLTLKNPDIAIVQAKRVLRYLAGTAGYGLLYRSHHNAPSELTVHSDASWAPQGEKSHGGTVVCVAGTAISWKSGRQSITAQSTAESELVQQVVGYTLGMANKATLDSLSDGTGYELVLKGDNQAANFLANDSAGSWRTRHLLIRASVLREAVQTKAVRLEYEKSADMTADCLTKHLSAPLIQRQRELLGMFDGTQWGVIKRLVVASMMMSQAEGADNNNTNQTRRRQDGDGVGFWEWVERVQNLLVTIYMCFFLILVTVALALYIYDMIRNEIREWSVILGPRISAVVRWLMEFFGPRVSAFFQWLSELVGPRVSSWIRYFYSGWVQGRQDWDRLQAEATTRTREWVEPRMENVRVQWQRMGSRFFGAEDEEEPFDEPSPERETTDTVGETLGERTGYSTPVRRRGPTSSPQVSRVRDSRDQARSSRRSSEVWEPGQAAGSSASAAAPAAAVPAFPVESPPAADIPTPTPSTGGGRGDETPRTTARRVRRQNGHKIVTDRHHELFHLTAQCERYPYGLHAEVMPPTYKLPCGACAPQEEMHLKKVYMSMHGEKYHSNEDCWGLRNRTSSIQMKRACRVCAAGVLDEPMWE